MQHLGGELRIILCCIKRIDYAICNNLYLVYDHHLDVLFSADCLFFQLGFSRSNSYADGLLPGIIIGRDFQCLIE